MEVPLAEARDQLGWLVDRVTHRGERLTLTRRGRRLAVLVSVEEIERLDRLASGHGASVEGEAGLLRHPNAGLSVPPDDVAGP